MLPWNLEMIGVPDAWQLAGRGSPDVVIAVLDTGITINHPSLQHAFPLPPPSWNFVDGSQPPLDDNGVWHGTFIAGILIGNGQFIQVGTARIPGIQGICPGCRLLPLKVPLADLRSTHQRQAAAIRAVPQLAPLGTRQLIINLSWRIDPTIDNTIVHDAIKNVTNQGAIVVASAGNLGDPPDDTQNYPANYPEVISVGAITRQGHCANYSKSGPRVKIWAPGGGTSINECIFSARPEFPPPPPWSWPRIGATSWAAPHVAGVAALVASAKPSLQSQEIVNIVLGSALQFSDLATLQAIKLVNANEAVKMALGIP